MQLIQRRTTGVMLAGLVAATLAVPMADQASAATTTVRIKSDALSATQPLNRLSGPVPRMFTALGTSSKWLKTDTDSGYATYKSVTSNVCLTGRQSLQGLNVVTIETCIAGSPQQQWRLGASREFQLRLNGLSAEVNLASDKSLKMSLFTGKANQKFTITPA